MFIGGHQKVLHYGMPDLKRGMASLSHLSLDEAPRVPGCTIYYRLAVFTEVNIVLFFKCITISLSASL